MTVPRPDGSPRRLFEQFLGETLGFSVLSEPEARPRRRVA